MEKSFIFYKKQNIVLPSENILKNIFLEYGDTITFIYSDKKSLHVNKDYNDFDTFQEDFYNEVDEKFELVIIFYNKKNLYFYDKEKDKSFCHTKEPIFISSSSINFVDIMNDFDNIKFKNIFDMFLKDNVCIKLSLNKTEIFGTLEKYKDYFISNKISEYNMNIDTNIDMNMEQQKCYFCDPFTRIIADTYLINKSITVCQYCFDKLNCFKCKKCGQYYSGKYRSFEDGICLECYMKTKLDISCYLIDSWIGISQLTKFIDIDQKIIQNKIKLNDILKNKSLNELHELRLKTFKASFENNKEKFEKDHNQIFHKISKIICIKKED